MSSARKIVAPTFWEQPMGRAPKKKVDKQCLGIGENLDPEVLLKSAIDLSYHHVCQTKGHEFEKDVQSAKVFMQSPETFKELPIAMILTPTDLSRGSELALTEIDERFDSSAQKRGILDQVVKRLESKGLSQTMIEDVVSVSDELYTNAVYNAPFVDRKTQKNPGISRHSAEVRLPAGKYARFFMAHDETRLLVGCMDPFGSLNLKHFLKRIHKSYTKGPAATMNFGAGGAGLGSYIIFNAGSSLYFGVWPGEATVLCCVVPLGLNYRTRAQLPKHLHWYEEGK